MGNIRLVTSAAILTAVSKGLASNFPASVSASFGISRRDTVLNSAIISATFPQDSNYARTTLNASNKITGDSNASFRYHHLRDIERILCLSDLHTDHPSNFDWVTGHCEQLQPNDVLIVAGDISHKLSTFRDSLRLLVDRCHVMFVPGNHEAWLEKNDEKPGSSFQKLESIYAVCREEGALVDPVFIEGSSPVWILPLEAWYDGTLSFDESLCEGFERWPWVDFERCIWPGFPPYENLPNARIPQGLVDYFLARNQKYIFDPWRRHVEEHPDASTSSVITVSHFAPNFQCLPDWMDLSATRFQTDMWLDHGAGTMSAKFAKVAGTSLLDEQIRRNVPPSLSRRHIHVFGHSHRPKDFEFDSVRYVHNPLGKPRERELYMVSPNVTFQRLWENGAEIPGDTVLRYWEQYGGGTEMLQERLERVRPGRYQR